MARLILRAGLFAALMVALPAFPAPVVIAAASSWVAETIVAGMILNGMIGWVGAMVAKAVIGFATSSLLNGAISKSGGSGATQDQPNFQAEARDRLQVVRSSVDVRRIVYGQAMVSGPLVYAESSSIGGGTNNLLNLVIALAGHEVEEIGAIYFDDELVPFGSTGEGVEDTVSSGRFVGYASIVRHLGGAAQTADATLVATSAGIWTTAHRLRGVAYIYLRLIWSPDVFPNGIPNIKAVVKGKKVYDPRSATTAWSDNWALCVRDYLTADYGFGCSSAEVDDTLVSAAANIADENVALDATPTYQKRYTCNGTVNLADRPLDNLRALLTAGAGACVYAQGTYRLFAGAYRTPSAAIDASWLRGGAQVQPRPSRRELFNAVRGTFSDPDRYWQPTDFPAVTNATYETQDGGDQIARDIELPFTTNVVRAQRIAKIHLEKSRQGMTVFLPCNLKAFGVAVWDTVTLTLDVFGFSAKVFLVTGWTFNEDGGIDLVLQEEASGVYDWAYGDATAVDTAPDTVLASPFSAIDVSGLTATSGTADLFVNGDGTVVPRVHLRWTAPANPFVVSYQVQFARLDGSPTEWRDAPPVLAPATDGYAFPVEDGVAYDLRVRAFSPFGNAGAWVYVRAHTVAGKTELPSDVTGAQAVQQGATVVLGCNAIADADLDSIEIRVQDAGQTDWDDGSPLANILRGQTATTAALPPGTWELLFKAKDTSGNYSASAARVTLTVTADGYTTIESAPQATDWLGTRTNMVQHWTGVLTPDSQSLASALGWEVFDQYVPDAYADCYYEAPVIDKGIDAAARIYGDIVSVLGPGETTGVAAPALEVDTRLAAGSFAGFAVWSVGTATFRYLKARIHVDTVIGKPVIMQFTPTIDAPARTETGTAAVGGGGSAAVSFATPFHVVPVLNVSPQGSGDVSASYASLAETGFTAYFKSGGVAAAGTISYAATGA